MNLESRLTLHSQKNDRHITEKYRYLKDVQHICTMNRYINSSIGWLRIFAILEGLSFLVLLFIAMPLKYMWDQPQMVEIVGMTHGVLFIIYVLLSLIVGRQRGWKFGKTTWKVLIASFIPFGTFYIDSKILAREHQRVLAESV